LPRRDRLSGEFGSDGLNQGGYRDHTTRRIPLPDGNDNRLDLPSYRQPQSDIRYRDNYSPYESPLPRDYNSPRLPLPNDRLNPGDYRNNNDYRNDYPAPPRPAIRPTEELSEVEQIQQHLSARYGNPVVQRFIFNVTPEQTLNVYREASQLIDSRHLQPTSYDARTKRAANNLVQGLRNREFLAANRITPSAAQTRSFESAMSQLIQSRPVTSQTDAVQMVYAMANLAHQHVGIRPTTVVLEFVYGATETLDKYSTFLPEETTRQPSASALDSSVVGIGVEIKPHDEGVEVVKALKGGPAEAGGLQAGDIIVGINGKSLRGQNLNFAVDQIAGPINTPIYLTVVRNGRQLSPMTLTRREVKILSVSEVRMMGQQRDVGYIKLDKFAQSSGKEIDEALMNLHRSGMQSLVLDLRGNPGGLLTTAIELSNKFLPSGTIVSTRGRTTQDNMQEKASNTQTWKVPLVVLIDENSASASEIFAAAIQENGRGVIVGRQSYGKGTVQTHFPLRSVGGNLKLTTAKFYSPKGREMANAGVTPDVQVTATSYRGTPSTADQDIQSALEVAQSGRVRDYLAATPRPSYQIGR
jgi:carboxyl-terminal processing protease